MNTKFTPAQKTDIVNQYWNGTSVKDLCELHHIPRSTLYTWLKPYKSVYASRHATMTSPLSTGLRFVPTTSLNG